MGTLEARNGGSIFLRNRNPRHLLASWNSLDLGRSLCNCYCYDSKIRNGSRAKSKVTKISHRKEDQVEYYI